jgi:hypothetical protein
MARAMVNRAATIYQEMGLREEELSVHIRHNQYLLSNGSPDTVVVMMENVVSEVAEYDRGKYLEVSARQVWAAALAMLAEMWKRGSKPKLRTA